MRTTRVNGVSLAYYVDGSGPPVLCIMGLGGRGTDWNPAFIAAMTPHHEMIRFDNRGTGRSDRPEEDYSLDVMADEAVAILDAVDRARAHVLGVSMGGMIAQLVALRHPARVDRLVLIATHAGGATVTQPTPAAMATLMADRTRPPAELVRAAMTTIAAPGFAEKHPEAIDALVANAVALPTPPASFARQMQAIMQSDRSARLGDIAAPTLVVHGTEDPLVPYPNGEVLARGIPGARLVTVPECGHLPMWECPDALAREIRAFLSTRVDKRS
jgi:pimeloyl-ACP methyl ester carboxylesterase